MPRQDEATLICSFCGKSQHEVRKLIAGPTVYICDECIKLCNEVIAKEEGERRDLPPDRAAPRPKGDGEASRSSQLLRCSFCGNNQREVRQLIAGPTVYICDECIGLCNDIIAEEIDLEGVAFALRSVLPGDARAFLATILERGSGAAERLSDIDYKRRRRFFFAGPVRRVLYRFRKRLPDEALVLLALLNITSEWRALRSIVGEREPLPPASSPGTEVELPAWVRPVAERLTSTVEVLEALRPRFEEGRLEESRDSLEFATAQLRHARDLLMGGPPKPAAAS